MHLVCCSCMTINSVPESRLPDHPNCGKCKSPLLTGDVLEANTQKFQRLVNKSELPIVVDFWAPWCGPCKMMAPVFSQVAKTYQSKAIFIKINTEDQQQLAAQFGIRSIPTLKIFKNGKVVADMNGALPKAQLQAWLNAHIQ